MKQKRIIRRGCKVTALLLAGCLAILTAREDAGAGNADKDSVTPTDVYYLARSVDESLVRMYELKTVFEKKRISNNLRPRNVYEKVLNIADQFNFLHNNAIDGVMLEEARHVDAKKASPRHVYHVLSILRDYLRGRDAFVGTTGERTPKTPGDVFQILRQIGAHHLEIAKRKNIRTDWAAPACVYNAVVTEILPAAMACADESGIKYEEYAFPGQPFGSVLPRNVYKLLHEVYVNFSKRYMQKKNYRPIILEPVSDCDDISPADVFDLCQIIASEMRAEGSNKLLLPKLANRYARWKESKDKIVPGDVFRLVQYHFILSKRILEESD